MKILHINSYYNSSTLYKYLYKYLDFKKVNQKIYVPVKNKINKKNISDSLKNGDYFFEKTYNFLDRVLYFTKISKSYKSLLNNIFPEDINLIHAHSLFVNGGIAYKLFKNHNINYIVTVQNTDMNLFFKKLFHLRYYGRKILYGADKIIFMTPSYKRRLINEFIPVSKRKFIEQKSTIIPSGVNDFWLNNVNNESHGINDKIKLIYAGRIDKNKNVLNICKVVQNLNDTGYSADLKIIGKGPEKANIEKYISDFDYIQLLDYMPKEELLNNYRNSDIFIMPSYNETFGLVYIEAMSQGLPIIYTQNEGVDGYFKEGSVGYAVNPDDINDMAEKIKLIADNYVEMSENAVKEAQRFSWDKVSDQYIDIYEEIK